MSEEASGGRQQNDSTDDHSCLMTVPAGEGCCRLTQHTSFQDVEARGMASRCSVAGAKLTELLVFESQGRRLDLEEPNPGEGGGEGLVQDEYRGSWLWDAALQMCLGHLGWPETPAATRLQVPWDSLCILLCFQHALLTCC
jgi:hypothetical protein